ncbi:MAG: DUF2934 domain-containing protein [Vicinamibacterales bacterium]|nr:DUF2934 domain-containing protein [Vicinamibacterales bacterium]
MVKNTTSGAFIVVSGDPISERAYEIYVGRGRSDGSDLEDWLQAERELSGVPTLGPRRVLREVKKAPKQRHR